jgi:hypothetical protein
MTDVPHRFGTPLFTVLLSILLIGCGAGDRSDAGADTESAAAAPDATAPTMAAAFLANLRDHCGQAFPGRLALEPPGDEMLDGDELLVVHVRGCADTEMLLPFHIEKLDGTWDRSRTWIFRLTDGNRLELRHDHRKEDGSEDEVTWYGAFTLAEGTATQQEFLREAPAQDGAIRGWRVIVEPGVRYVYGTIRDGEWTWRVDFDLSTPMADPPPPPWGYEDGSGPPR